MTAMLVSGKPTILVMALLVALPASAQEPAKEAPKDKPAPAIRVAIDRVKAEATIEASGALGLASSDGSLWISQADNKSLLRVDPKTNKTTQTITLAASVCPGMTAGVGALWAPLCGKSTAAGVLRIDTKTNAVTTTITKGVMHVSANLRTAVGSLWALIDDKGTLARLDPATNAIVAEVYIGAGASGTAVGQEALWVTNKTENQVARVSAHTNLIEEWIKTGKAPVAVAFGEGAVWTLNAGDATVSRIDPKTNKVTDTIKLEVPVTGGAIAVGEGSVWVSVPGAPLIRIDPRGKNVVQIFTAVSGGGSVFVAEGAVWLSLDGKKLSRFDPKRVEATR